MMVNNNKKLISLKEAAAHPSIPFSESKLRKMVMKREFPFYKENPEVRTSPVYVTIEDILNHLSKFRVPSRYEVADQAAIPA